VIGSPYHVLTSSLKKIWSNCCYVRSEILGVGRFDEKIDKPGGEDVSLSLKLKRKGWEFGFTNNAIVYHDYRNNVIDFLRTFFNYGRGCRVATQQCLTNLPWSSPISAVARSRARGGYGYFGAQLAVPMIPWSNISLDLLAIAQSDLQKSDNLSFSALKLLQRIAYYYGWKSRGWA